MDSPVSNPTHYQVLNLDLSASPTEIRLGLERLVSEATVLSATSREASSELWARIRQIRYDLLSGRKNRLAYDLAILTAQKANRTSSLPHDSQSNRGLAPVAERVVGLAGAASVKPRRKHLLRDRGPHVPVLAVLMSCALIVVLLAGAVVAAQRITSRSVMLRPHVALLASSAPDNGYASGAHLVLRWTPVPGASEYRVQIAVLPAGVQPYNFPPSARTIITRDVAVTLSVLGPQQYVWRLAALVDRRWTAYSKMNWFAVLAPLVARPAGLLSRFDQRHPGQVELCWSPVPRAVGYRVRVDGGRPVMMQETCIWVRALAGRHHWAVSALVRGAHVTAGPYATGVYVVRSSPKFTGSAQTSRSRAIRGPSTIARATTRGGGSRLASVGGRPAYYGRPPTPRPGRSGSTAIGSGSPPSQVPTPTTGRKPSKPATPRPTRPPPTPPAPPSRLPSSGGPPPTPSPASGSHPMGPSSPPTRSRGSQPIQQPSSTSPPSSVQPVSGGNQSSGGGATGGSGGSSKSHPAHPPHPPHPPQPPHPGPT